MLGETGIDLIQPANTIEGRTYADAEGVMELGIFLPIAKNGFIASKTSPQFMPTWELNRRVTQKCEALGFEFALSMIKFRGFGGDSEYWDYALDSYSLMAGLAPVTERIALIPSVATLTLHPAVAARMGVTLDAMSHGRFGLNIVSGWYRDEYRQMGLWPGDDHFDNRYDYATEYVTILRELWTTGRSSFKGKFFSLDDCSCQPGPTREPQIVCAGQSGRGLRFTAEMGDRNFVIGDVDVLKKIGVELETAARAGGRKVGIIGLFNVIAAATDEEANRRFDHFVDGADEDAIRCAMGQISLDSSEGMARSFKMKAMFMGLPTMVGSFNSVAAHLDRIAYETPAAAVMLAFPDFDEDLDNFGRHILPRLECRRAQNRVAAVNC